MDYLEDWNSFRQALKQDPRIAQLIIGSPREELQQKFKPQKNKPDSDVWSYRINSKFSFHNPNYLYLHFENDQVASYRIRRYPLFSKARNQFKKK